MKLNAKNLEKFRFSYGS